MLGAWEIAKMEESSLPEMVATGFDEATKNIKGAEYRPVLYCGKQVVAGTNHMVISCKGSSPAEPFGAAGLQG